MTDAEQSNPKRSVIDRIPTSLIVLLAVAFLLRGPAGTLQAFWKYTQSLITALLGGDDLFVEVVCQTAPLTLSAAAIAFAYRCKLITFKSFHSLIACSLILLTATWSGGQIRRALAPSANQEIAMLTGPVAPATIGPTDDSKLSIQGLAVSEVATSPTPTGSNPTGSNPTGPTPTGSGTPISESLLLASADVTKQLETSNLVGMPDLGDLSTLGDMPALAASYRVPHTETGADLSIGIDAGATPRIPLSEAIDRICDWSAGPEQARNWRDPIPSVALLPEPGSVIGFVAKGVNQTFGYLVYYRPRLFLAALLLGVYIGWSWLPMLKKASRPFRRVETE